jgi:solute carrier family 50 protein (sugar transporter)
MSIDCNGSLPCKYILEYAFPGLGGITAVLIYASALPAIAKINKSHSLGVFNPIPFALQISSAMAWILYGFLLKNYFLFFPNLVGMLLGIYYTFSLIPVVSIRQRELILRIVLVGIAFALVGALISFVGLEDFDKVEQRLPLGITSVAIQIVFFASPISVIESVVKVYPAILLI